MRCIAAFLALLAVPVLAAPAEASIVFSTQSTATQTLTSPLFGGTPTNPASVTISAFGLQTFTLDPATGFANVTSAFKGTDFPTPVGLASYDLYNTATTGTVTQNPNGTYNVRFDVLFELKITSGPLAGTTFETLTNATFVAANVPSLPFPGGTVFASPEPVGVYVKTNPSGLLPPPGTLVGFSSNRTVTINQVVPEPATMVVWAALGVAGMAGLRRRELGRRKPTVGR